MFFLEISDILEKIYYILSLLIPNKLQWIYDWTWFFLYLLN